MKVDFKKSFIKDLKRIKNKSLQKSIYEIIVQVESASSLNQVKNLKKLAGYEFYYRIRVGDYRIGLKVEKEIIHFVVFEHRKDIYKGFP
jgi:mRNA interferase RelE/StbE